MMKMKHFRIESKEKGEIVQWKQKKNRWYFTFAAAHQIELDIYDIPVGFLKFWFIFFFRLVF